MTLYNDYYKKKYSSAIVYLNLLLTNCMNKRLGEQQSDSPVITSLFCCSIPVPSTTPAVESTTERPSSTSVIWSVEVIVGVALGAVCLIIIVVVGVMICWMYRRTQEERKEQPVYG